MDILLRQHAQKKKAKLTVNFLAFPSVKFRKIWQIASKYFTLVGAHFSGKSRIPVFCSDERHKYEKNGKNCLYNPYFFRVQNSYPAGCDML